VIIRPATPADLLAIGEIQQASPEASQWPPTSDTCLVADDRGLILGFLVTRPLGPDEHEVLNLAVAPAARRRGVARNLLQYALAAAPGRWFLEVRASNLPAIRFYENACFQASGRRENYYNSPRESAIVMTLQK
jgi:ribosomal-protein-alanine N-acetyltransferase